MHKRYAKLATRLIKKHGRKLELISHESSGDPWDPKLVPKNIPVVGVQTKYGEKEIDGENVRSSDKCFLLDGSVTPDPRHRLKDPDSGVEYSIVRVNAIQPGGTKILFKVQARV